MLIESKSGASCSQTGGRGGSSGGFGLDTTSSNRSFALAMAEEWSGNWSRCSRVTGGVFGGAVRARSAVRSDVVIPLVVVLLAARPTAYGRPTGGSKDRGVATVRTKPRRAHDVVSLTR